MIYNTINRILILALFVTLANCGGAEADEFTEAEIALSEILQEKFDTTQLLIYGADTLLANENVLAYYDTNAYHPIWTEKAKLNATGTEFMGMIDDAYDYGFMPEMFHAKLIHKMVDSSLMDAEMLLTNAFYLYTTHINMGCIDSSDYSYVWKKDSLTFSLDAELDRVRNGENVTEVITSHQPQNWDYLQLQKGLVAFLDSFVLDTNHYEVPPFKEDSTACYDVAKEALIGHLYIDATAATNDSVFIERLKAFQLINGLKDDAIVGKWTGRALAKSNRDRFYQAALSMEKWRWKKSVPNRYIRVNIPEFTLYFIDSLEVKRKHRVVVGAYATQTPEFQATMQRMITNPFWHVPYSISSTEILYGARKDSAYFSKRGYKIFQSGEQVDPTGVDWSTVRQGNFPYRVRQNGGGGNSLGRIKFLFPNPHSVFVHDTPSKRLFSNDVRAYSHGCVRLHQPFDLAKSILEVDQHKVQGDTLDSLVHRGLQRVLELEEPFDVFIEYFTTTGDSSGTIIFHPDIYGRDEKFLTNSFKKFDF
ncbi:MAG: murein L,D-transpeptidase YcbB/YkuD [Crocinitomix sp.]|jgi:murein L,D-transpeptidase YcbB/YkuD